MTRRPRPRAQARQQRKYGIAEWFGHDYANSVRATRDRLIQEAVRRRPDFPCRFRESFPAMAPRNREGGPNLNCTKPGGVCCLRLRTDRPGEEPEYGRLVTTCPVRFIENGDIFHHIAAEVLAAPHWRFAKELNFLEPDVAPPFFLPPDEAEELARQAQEPAEVGGGGLLDMGAAELETGQQSAEDNDEEGRSVGRIDMVLAAADEEGRPTGDWCAVELQAVYFQGPGMSHEWPVIRDQLLEGRDTPPASVKNRRPDFRSSGPKRLLPQLQIKVPSLRRWGKKMAVVVDAPFFSTFGPMKRADHVSNADIVWCVVDYVSNPEGLFQLRVLGTYMTTLEEAVVGLTAGKPKTKPDFERALMAKMGDEAY